ncbi:MAG: serine/threonine protein kinase [Pyrinomonadaceae bacterium]|nr:serine/threonine protein kinase [Pyrinomonadaceae bacterium]
MTQAGKLLQKRYRIEKEIGQGGMGTVFVAVDERFGSTVAIKQTVFTDENLTKAFEREARLLNGLKHPALPKVSDHFVEENGQYIVMEFITGEDLSEILEKRDAPFSVSEVMDWAEQLCDALDYLHNQEMPVIHRDIKPQNLKLTPEGRIILLDFGLAKGNPNDASHKTQAKSIFGFSRNYASLEQIQGTGTDPQSDLYALGATLYHLMTGIPPADALTRAMNVLNAKSDPLIPAHMINPTIPLNLSNVLLRSMALNANERPSTAEELGLMLKNCDREVETEVFQAQRVHPAELFSQKTKLMSAEESSIEANETSINAARATQLPPAAATQPKYKRRIFAAAATLVVTAAGFSVFYADMTQTDPVRPAAEPVSLASGDVPAAKDRNSSESVETDQNAAAVDPLPAEPVIETAARTSEKTAPAAVKPDVREKPAVQKPAKGEKEPFVVQSDEGTIRIFENRLETDEFILDDAGIRPKMTRGIPPFGKIRLTREQLKGLSPEERQKFAELVEAQVKAADAKKRVPEPPKVGPSVDHLP